MHKSTEGVADTGSVVEVERRELPDLPMNEELEIKALVLVKGEDTYYFLYTADDTDLLVEALIDTALDPGLNLGWNEVVYSLRQHGLAPADLDLRG